jgi:hypothetical protein
MTSGIPVIFAEWCLLVANEPQVKLPDHNFQYKYA